MSTNPNHSVMTFLPFIPLYHINLVNKDKFSYFIKWPLGKSGCDYIYGVRNINNFSVMIKDINNVTGLVRT